MKKLFTMVALAFTTLTMNAQDDSKMTVYVGGGLSTLVGSDTDAMETALSYKVGISYDWRLTDSFSIIPGLEFANNALNSENVEGTIDRFYIQVPILASYKFNVSDNLRIGVNAGPYLAYGLFGSDLEDSYGKYNVFDSDGFERFDAGIRAGISLDFSNFVIGIEYNRGLTKQNSDLTCYNQVIGATIGYRF